MTKLTKREKRLLNEVITAANLTVIEYHGMLKQYDTLYDTLDKQQRDLQGQMVRLAKERMVQARKTMLRVFWELTDFVTLDKMTSSQIAILDDDTEVEVDVELYYYTTEE